MFKSKESSNRIELSRLVQDLLNFGDFGSMWLWGGGWVGVWWVGGWVGGGWMVGGAPHACVHAHTCTHTHACMVNMIISCKWLPHWGNPWEFHMMSYVHACMCVGGTLSPPPTPHPLGGPPESVKIQ